MHLPIDLSQIQFINIDLVTNLIVLENYKSRNAFDLSSIRIIFYLIHLSLP